MTWIFLPVQTMAQYTILGECLICFDFLIQIAMHVVFGYKSRMGEDAPLHTFLGHSKVSNTEILKRQLFLYQQVYIKQLGLYFQSPFTSHHPFQYYQRPARRKVPNPKLPRFPSFVPKGIACMAWNGQRGVLASASGR